MAGSGEGEGSRPASPFPFDRRLGLPVSRLGFTLQPSAPGRGGADPTAATVLQRARAGGVTLFDVGPPALRSRTLATFRLAFPAPDPTITLIVSAPDRESPGLDNTHLPRLAPSELNELLGAARELASAGWRVLAEWDLTAGSGPSGADVPAALGAAQSVGTLAGWGYRVNPRGVSRDLVAGALPPSFLSAEISMMDPGALDELEGVLAGTSTVGIARDPTRAGLLEGASATGAPPFDSVGRRPVPVRELQRRYAPVLRLGFLARPGQRTLGQAAAEYVLSSPAVAAALIPLPPPERLAGWLALPTVPPLNASELQSIRMR